MLTEIFTIICAIRRPNRVNPEEILRTTGYFNALEKYFNNRYKYIYLAVTGLCMICLCMICLFMFIVSVISNRDETFPADPEALNYPAFFPIVCGKRVDIQFVYVNGITAPPESVHPAIAIFRKNIAGQINFLENINISLTLEKSGVLTESQRHSILKMVRHRGPSVITIIVANNHALGRHINGEEIDSVTYRGLVLDGEVYNVILISAEVVNIYGAEAGLDRNSLWAKRLLHELGHCISVPMDKSHIYDSHHCTNPFCIMNNGAKEKLEFCSACRRDIDNIIHQTGFILLNPTESHEPVISWYSELIKMNPHRSTPFSMRALKYYQLEMYDFAIRDYNEAIKLNNLNPELYIDKGNCYYMMKDYDRAIIDYSASISINPNSETSYYNRALAKLSMKNYQSCIDDFNKAVTMGGNRSLCYSYLGETYYELKKYAEAIDYLTRAIELNSLQSEQFVLRGNAYVKIGDISKAIKDYESAIYLDSSAETMNYVAWIYSVHPDRAIRNGERALALSKRCCEMTHWKNPSYIDTLACAYAECKEFELAIQYTNKAILLSTSETKQVYESRLKQYKSGRPWRELTKW